MPGVPQTVFGIARKTADGFGNDKVDFTVIAVPYHSEKSGTQLCPGAGNTVIVVDACE